MSLYTKYAPDSFMSMYGNATAVKALASVLAKPDHIHSFLFTGEKGTGKTLSARLLAAVLRADIVEINTSDDRGIDTIRGVIEQCQYQIGNPVLYIFDECHQLTIPAQEALLKIMQDTPDQVYFALCTTNPEKLKEALKSRCHLTTLTPLSYRDTVTLLRDVVGKEKAKISLEVLDAIAEMAHGSAREALVKLEGCLGLSEEEALEVLKSGNEETHPAFELCRCMLNQSGWSAYGAILKDIPAVEVESVRQMVLSYMYSVLVKSPQDRPARIIAEFKNPFYDSGRAGLALAAYKVYTLGR